MQGFVIFSLCLAFLAATVSCEEDLGKKYENFDIEKVLQSKRLVQNYVNCLIDKGPCSPEGSDLKKTLPEILQTTCAKCTEQHIKRAFSVLKRVKTDYNNEYNIILAKWDPTGEYTKKFEAKFGKIE